MGLERNSGESGQSSHNEFFNRLAREGKSNIPMGLGVAFEDEMNKIQREMRLETVEKQGLIERRQSLASQLINSLAESLSIPESASLNEKLSAIREEFGGEIPHLYLSDEEIADLVQ